MNMSKPVYHMAVTKRYFSSHDCKLHIVDGLWSTYSLCSRKVFGAYETTVIEDKDDSRLCSKCSEKMPWDQVRGKTKDYLNIE